MANDNTSSMFFLSAIDTLADPVRNTRWRLLLPPSIFAATGIKVSNGLDFGSGMDGMNDFALHVDGCSVPELNIKDDYLSWMGFKSAFPVNTDISADLAFESKLLEDFRSFEAIHAWGQSMINTGLLVDGSDADRMSVAGSPLGLGPHKDIRNPSSTVLRNNSIAVELYDWSHGTVIMRLKLINAHPTKIEGFDLIHSEDAKLLSFKFTLHCDRWTIYVPPGYKA